MSQCETIRSLKMFANRARIVCANARLAKIGARRATRKNISCLVGLSALADIGQVEPKTMFRDDEEFSEYKVELEKNLSRFLSQGGFGKRTD